MKKFYLKKMLMAVVTLLCSVAASGYNFEVDGIYYNVTSETDLTVKVTSGKKYSGDVIIPSTVAYNEKTYSVTSIGEVAFSNCSGLTSITIPNSVTSIGNYAFYYCSSLTSVTIPNSVTSIGSYAFSYCSSLTSVTIPNSVTSIGDDAFFYCSSLTSVTIPNSVTSIESGAFHGCSSLISVTIPNSVTSIGSGAFNGCSGLTSITIPNSVTSIGEGAFVNCSSLKSVINLSPLTLAKGSTDYGYIAYYADKVINAPNGTIEDDFVFAKIDSVNTLCCYIGNDTVITLPDNYKGENYVIGNSAFSGCSGLTSVTIPNSVTSIGSGAFSGCSGLTSITIPNSVTSIGEGAFYNCSGLTSITIPNSVTSIGNGAFSGCSSLTNVTIPKSVTSIGNNAFSGCSGLTSITIPNSVTSIGVYAFAGCAGLTSITIPNNVTSIEEDTFRFCSGLTSITIPNSVTSIGKNAFYGCSGLTSIIVEEGNSVYDSRDNCNAIIETATNTLVQGCNNTVIPGNATSIGHHAFYNCTGLTSIIIPESVTSIGYNAFGDCAGLTSVYSLNETPAKIQSSSFYSKCYTNATLYVPQGSLEAYKAADGWKKFKNIVEFDPTVIEDVTEEDAPAFEITAGGIQFTAAEGKAVAVYTTAGALVEKIDSYAGEEITLDKGVYIICVGDKAVKVRL